MRGFVALIATLGAIFVAACLTGSQAFASHVQCGDVLRQNTTLDEDLDCSEPPRIELVEPGRWECVGTGCLGVAVGGYPDPVTLDLGGHTITGPGQRSCIPLVCYSDGISTFGRAIVENGTVQRWDTAVFADDPTKAIRNMHLLESGTPIDGAANEIADNLIKNNSNSTFIFSEEGASRGDIIITRNTVSDSNGIVFGGSRRIVLDRNVVINSGRDGIVAYFDRIWSTGEYLLSGNRVEGSGGDGIYISAPMSITLTKNVLTSNGGLGINAPEGTAGSKNHARHNGNPAQCVPSYLCGPPGQAKK